MESVLNRIVAPAEIANSVFEAAVRRAMEADDIASALRDIAQDAPLGRLIEAQRPPLTDPSQPGVATLVSAHLSWSKRGLELLTTEQRDELAKAAESSYEWEFPRRWSKASADLSSVEDPELAQLAADRDEAESLLLSSLAAVLEDLFRLETNRLLGDTNFDLTWKWEATPGLRRSVIDAEFFPRTVTTEGMRALAEVVSTMDGGSVGLAGPRGIGKSTVLRWLPSGLSEDEDEFVSVVVSTPVKYDSRDFLLHLFAETCLAFLPRGNEGDTNLSALLDEVAPKKRRGISRLSSWQQSRVWSSVLRILPMALLALSASMIQNSPTAALIVGASAACVATVMRMWLAMRIYLIVLALAAVGEPVLFPDITPWPLVLGFSGGALVLAFTGLLRRDDEDRYRFTGYGGSDNIWRMPTALIFLGRLGTFLGIALMAFGLFLLSLACVNTMLFGLPDGVLGAIDPAALLAPVSSAGAGAIVIALAAASAAAAGSGRFIAAQRERQEEEYRRDYTRLSSIETRVWAELKEVRLQQSFKAASEGSISINPSSLLSASAKSSTESSWSPHVEGLAELTGRYRRLLRLLGEQNRILVAIDELDKLEDVASVAAFLNDLKGIFGVPGVLYVTTISLEAAASFKRKGAPLREAFDSCFDEVVLLSPLGLEDTRRLINSRIVAMPRPFKALLHGLSGGLPREVVRLARRLQVAASGMHEIDLESAARALVRSDLHGRFEVLELLGLLQDPTSPLSRMVTRAKAALESYGEVGGGQAADVDVGEFALAVSTAHDDETAISAARVAASFGVAAAAMARFSNGLDGAARRALEGDPSAEGIEVLAEATRLINVSPSRSWDFSGSFRRA